MDAASLRQMFPQLKRVAKTSDEDPDYNCHAWGADQSDAWWEPAEPELFPDGKPVYWPPGLVLYHPTRDNYAEAYGIENFKAAFETQSYAVCEDGSLEDGFEKIAIYVSRELVKHTARQLPWGRWTSKWGEEIDLEHDDPQSLEGPVYGTVAVYMKRPRVSTNVPAGLSAQ